MTAAQASTLIAAANTADDALTQQQMAFDDAGTAWQLAYDPLAASAVSLIKNLEAKLDPLDPRWLGFGLQMPGASSTPGKPTGLTAHADDAGNTILQCNAPPLATRLRWRGLIVGVEVDYRLVASTTEPMASVPNVMPGQTMQYAVQGVNDTLQGVLSDPILFTMPPAVEKKEREEQKAEAVSRKIADTHPVAANGRAHGHAANGNGHSNGHRRSARA